MGGGYMSSDWNDPEMNLAGLHMYYEQAKQGGPGAMSLDAFANVAMAWAAKADAEIERRGRKQGQKARRELAREILLKLIEIAPTAFDNTNSESPNEGARLAWSIADAFLKAEQL